MAIVKDGREINSAIYSSSTNRRSAPIQTIIPTLDEWELTVVCKQFIAASATSLLPFKMLFSTNWSNDSQPTQNKIKSGLLVNYTKLKYQIHDLLIVNPSDQKLLKLEKKGKNNRNIRAIPPKTSTRVSSHCFWAMLRLQNSLECTHISSDFGKCYEITEVVNYSAPIVKGLCSHGISIDTS